MVKSRVKLTKSRVKLGSGWVMNQVDFSCNRLTKSDRGWSGQSIFFIFGYFLTWQDPEDWSSIVIMFFLEYACILLYIIPYHYAIENFKHVICMHAHWWMKSTQLTTKCMIPSVHVQSTLRLCIRLCPFFSWAWIKILRKNIDTKNNVSFRI